MIMNEQDTNVGERPSDTNVRVQPLRLPVHPIGVKTAVDLVKTLPLVVCRASQDNVTDGAYKRTFIL